MSDSFTVLPGELLGIVVENLRNDRDRFGCFGRVCKKFAALAYSLPYTHLFVRDYVDQKHKPHSMFPSRPFPTATATTPKKPVNFMAAPSFSRIDKKKIDRITVVVPATNELIDTLAVFVNVKKMKFGDLGRLHSYNFRKFSHLKDLDIDYIDNADNLEFPALERLRIAVKHTSDYGGRRAMFIPSKEHDLTSKFISKMTSLTSLELGPGFFVDKKDLPNCKDFRVGPAGDPGLNDPFSLPRPPRSPAVLKGLH